MTGLEGGGNKTRKLEFLAGDAIETGADMLVTGGAIQSNHTRQTAAAAAKCTLKCALLHFGWTKDAGPDYRQVGNILLSSIMGAEMFLDETERPIEDQSPLIEFCEYLRGCGHLPYLIPAGASEHRLGSMGYMACAAEIVKQSKALDVHFDYVVHCTGSSSTQAGLVAGFAVMGEKTRVIGVSDDDETSIKRERVMRLANDALAEIRNVSPGLDNRHRGYCGGQKSIRCGRKRDFRRNTPACADGRANRRPRLRRKGDTRAVGTCERWSF